MLFTVEKKALWRKIILALFFLSLLGPWMYSVINVPAEYPCGSSIRLYGDFCGSPLLGFLVVAGNVIRFFVIVLELITGNFSGRAVEFFSGLALLPLFVMTSMILMIRRPDVRRIQIVNLLMWGMSCIPPLLLIIVSYEINAFHLWGPWLYIIVAVSAVALELCRFGSAYETDPNIILE